MAEHSSIEWTDATWNPITGCTLKSPGCANCYAMKLAGTRLKNHPSRAGLTQMTKSGPVWTGEVRVNEGWLDQPLRWKRPRMIFVCAHGDLYAPGVEPAWQRRIFEVMRVAKHHVFQVLTKRPDEMRVLREWTKPMPHVWLGCSVEDQTRADERRLAMFDMHQAGWMTWVSYEPALGPVDWRGWEFLKWMVSGGESDTDGKSARPTHPDWHRATRDYCKPMGIPFLFKQWGEYVPSQAYGGPFKEEDMGKLFRRFCIPAADEYYALPGKFEMRQDNFNSGAFNIMHRVGKKRAGRILDGVLHNSFPTQ